VTCELFCSPSPTCNGHGSCAPDPPLGVGAGGGWCSCDRFWFEKACTTKLDPIWSVEYTIDDKDIAQSASNAEFELAIPPYGLASAPVTIFADGFDPADMPASMQASRRVQARRQTGGSDKVAPDRWSFAGNIITLNPDGTKCDGNPQQTTNLTLISNVQALKANEVLTMYTWNVELDAWQEVSGAQSTNFSGVMSNSVKAPLDHFSAYVAVKEEYGDAVAAPVPPPPPAVEEEGGLSPGAIAALVLVPLALLGVFSYYLYQWDQNKRRQAGAKQQAASAEVGFDVPEPPAAPAPAAPAVESPGEPTPQQMLPPAEEAKAEPMVPPTESEWIECMGCKNPIKNTWPRCPTCRTDTSESIKARADGDAGAGARDLAIPDLQDEPENKIAAAAEQAMQPTAEPAPIMSPGELVAKQGFTGTCHNCQAPVKAEWPRCPGCKAAIVKPGEAIPAAMASPLPAAAAGAMGAMGALPVRTEEFTAECTNPNCRAPVKQKWKRCPSCKTAIARPEGELAAPADTSGLVSVASPSAAIATTDTTALASAMASPAIDEGAALPGVIDIQDSDRLRASAASQGSFTFGAEQAPGSFRDSNNLRASAASQGSFTFGAEQAPGSFRFGADAEQGGEVTATAPGGVTATAPPPAAVAPLALDLEEDVDRAGVSHIAGIQIETVPSGDSSPGFGAAGDGSVDNGYGTNVNTSLMSPASGDSDISQGRA